MSDLNRNFRPLFEDDPSTPAGLNPPVDSAAGPLSEGMNRRQALRAAATGMIAWAAIAAGGCEASPRGGSAAGGMADGAAAGSTGNKSVATSTAAGADPGQGYRVRNGRINQSLCSWCFKPHMDMGKMLALCKAMGLKSVELLSGAADLRMVKEAGLVCAMTGSHGFTDGMNRTENHEMCVKKITDSIDLNAELGFPNVITFSGMRKGMPDDMGLDNTVAGIKKVIGHAERKGVNLCIEMLNSRVSDHPMKGHPDYMADSIEWCVEVCKRVGSPRMKILFDIYHVQIMQGDVITRIRKYHQYIGHYHTAGNPGRGELDDAQEINYPPIMREIVKTGYQAYVGQEFIPTRDALAGIRQAVALCDV